MDAVRFLELVQEKDIKIQEKAEKIESMKSGSSVYYGFKTDTSITNSMEDKLIKIVEQQDKLNIMLQEFVQYRSDVIKMIYSIDSFLGSEILYKRFIDYLSITEVLSDLKANYSSYEAAIRQFEEKYKIYMHQNRY